MLTITLPRRFLPLSPSISLFLFRDYVFHGTSRFSSSDFRDSDATGATCIALGQMLIDGKLIFARRMYFLFFEKEKCINEMN